MVTCNPDQDLGLFLTPTTPAPLLGFLSYVFISGWFLSSTIFHEMIADPTRTGRPQAMSDRRLWSPVPGKSVARSAPRRRPQDCSRPLRQGHGRDGEVRRHRTNFVGLSDRKLLRSVIGQKHFQLPGASDRRPLSKRPSRRTQALAGMLPDRSKNNLSGLGELICPDQDVKEVRNTQF